MDETEENAKAAREAVLLFSELRQHTTEQHSQLFRWITASLLAINGGAALAILSNETLSVIQKQVGGSFFCAGIVCSLLVGVFSQKAMRASLTALTGQWLYWLEVREYGVRDEEREKGFVSSYKPAEKYGLIVQVLGWISALFFLAGAVSIGVSLEEVETRPLEIQAGYNPARPN